VVGLLFAALVGFDLSAGVELAKVLAASAVLYIGAAALKRPAAAWPMLFVTFAVLITVEAFDAGFDATWPVLCFGVLLSLYGLARGALRPAAGLPLQTWALLGFGTVAALALSAAPSVGSYLVAIGLLGHAGWDLYHHRVNKVVARSLAQFCLVLDTALASTIILITAMP